MQTLTRAQQRLHREELKLARLTRKLSSTKRTNEAIKRRLGQLIILLNWHNEAPEVLNQRLSSTATFLEKEKPSRECLLSGEQDLEKRTRKRESNKLTAPPIPTDAARELDQQRLKLGELMITHGFDTWQYATVFAALVNQAEAPSKSTTEEQKIT